MVSISSASSSLIPLLKLMLLLSLKLIFEVSAFGSSQRSTLLDDTLDYSLIMLLLPLRLDHESLPGVHQPITSSQPLCHMDFSQSTSTSLQPASLRITRATAMLRLHRTLDTDDELLRRKSMFLPVPRQALNITFQQSLLLCEVTLSTLREAMVTSTHHDDTDKLLAWSHAWHQSTVRQISRCMHPQTNPEQLPFHTTVSSRRMTHAHSLQAPACACKSD